MGRFTSRQGTNFMGHLAKKLRVFACTVPQAHVCFGGWLSLFFTAKTEEPKLVALVDRLAV
jgi:hypothetical protein